MKSFQDIAREVIDLKNQEREIKNKLFEYSCNYELIAGIAVKHPDVVTINWQKLAYPRERR